MRPARCVRIGVVAARGVACSPAARWRLADGKVLGSSTMTMQRIRRASRVEAELTEEVERRWGRAAARCGGALMRGRVGDGFG
jgi:hypothetical protein